MLRPSPIDRLTLTLALEQVSPTGHAEQGIRTKLRTGKTETVSGRSTELLLQKLWEMMGDDESEHKDLGPWATKGEGAQLSHLFGAKIDKCELCEVVLEQLPLLPALLLLLPMTRSLAHYWNKKVPCSSSSFWLVGCTVLVFRRQSQWDLDVQHCIEKKRQVGRRCQRDGEDRKDVFLEDVQHGSALLILPAYYRTGMMLTIRKKTAKIRALWSVECQ